MRHGNTVMAHKLFSAAVDITPEMAYKFVQVAKQMGIEQIVAPYEADAQLAYMWRTGKADIVITEDSDLLLFGASKVFFKMNTYGKGIEIDLSNLHKTDSFNYLSSLKLPSLSQLQTNQLMLLITCIMSGCDYLESIKGVGFKTALRLI